MTNVHNTLPERLREYAKAALQGLLANPEQRIPASRLPDAVWNIAEDMADEERKRLPAQPVESYTEHVENGRNGKGNGRK